MEKVSEDNVQGYEGFPKQLPEDCVEYTLFLIDSKLRHQKELISQLEIVRRSALKLTENLLKEYIWQREPFELKLETKDKAHLYGTSNFGDSVEDEWLIVYLLRELTITFPQLWVKVVDSGGEFLLIQAANALPRWLNPEIADNRVWIHNGALKIIPLSAALKSGKTEPISRSLTLSEARQIITSSPETLVHSPLIEEEAFYRLRNYPAQISESMHYALITIPRKLAWTLHERPDAIAPAVEAFYLRDPIAMKPLQSISSDILFPPEELVTVSTRFTKVLYAQLVSQQFAPPPSWQNILSKFTNDAYPRANTTNFAQLDVGMKVTSGMIMLLTDPKNVDSHIVRSIKLLLEDLVGDDATFLPTDTEIAAWKDSLRSDSETWLYINFTDFENELDGKSKGKGGNETVPGVFGPEPPPGFGDAKTQVDLRRIVENFERFLGDDEAELDGDLDDMDFDNDDEDNDSEKAASEVEDSDVTFDEKEFARMMREMMGMPSEEGEDRIPGASSPKPTVIELPSDDQEDADEENNIDRVMQIMEAELSEQGALNLEPAVEKIATLKGKDAVPKAKNVDVQEEANESDQEVDIDFNLAKNLLESYKSQAGLAGPGGNLLGLMGLQLPRDKDDET